MHEIKEMRKWDNIATNEDSIRYFYSYCSGSYFQQSMKC